jgi:propanediol dehydratase large subunit
MEKILHLNQNTEKPIQPEGDALGLWTVKDVAGYMNRSTRSIEKCLCIQSNQAGSIPHIRLKPATGTRCSIRFNKNVIALWVEIGCPSVDDFRKWQHTDKRYTRRM